MDIANLRLKFKPTLKDIEHSSTKCCLEIVPEVSYVDNIDKMQWTSDSDSIVYMVPMNYKIILKKKQGEDNNECLEKTYHSCVDLLPASSLSDINFGSGDVNRFISDTIIISTITANVCNNETKVGTVSQHVYNSNTNKTEKCVTIKESVLYKKNEELIDAAVSGSNKDKKQNNGTVKTIKYEDDESQYEAIEDTKPQNKEYITKNICTTKKMASNRVITIKYQDDKAQYKATADTKPKNKEYSTNNIISTTKKVVSKRKFSMRPICSVDTTDSITTVPETKTLDMFALECVNLRVSKNESLYHILNLKSNQNLQKNDVYLYKPISNMNTDSSFCFHEDRECPEIKVAKFVKKMELEIMPLKVILNEIYRKCSELGIMNQNKTFNKKECLLPVVVKNECNMNVTNLFWKEVQPKSNRVVYSVVFDT